MSRITETSKFQRELTTRPRWPFNILITGNNAHRSDAVKSHVVPQNASAGGVHNLPVFAPKRKRSTVARSRLAENTRRLVVARGALCVFEFAAFEFPTAPSHPNAPHQGGFLQPSDPHSSTNAVRERACELLLSVPK